MSRYIDADKIPYFHYLGDDTAAEGVDYALKGVIESRVPTEDVMPVKHGHWAKENLGIIIRWNCSACWNCYYLGEPKAKYCPNCGAKMDGDKNEP